MKKILATVASLTILTTASVGFGGGSTSVGVPGPGPKKGLTREEQILNHPVLQALGKLLNEKHGNQCTLPTSANDIRWMCTGAIPPVTEPTIEATGCGFALTITCPGETATVNGWTMSHYLNVPPGQKTEVKPTSEIISISNVTIQ